MTRTFIALEMQAAVQRNLEAVIRQAERLLPDVRWVDPASIHLTLAFLGELDEKQLAQATQAAQEAAKRSANFSYQLGSMGIFGTIQRPRVIWVGIEEPSGALLRLHGALKQELERRDFETEARPFSPHLTLARIKDPLHSDEQQQLQRLLSDRQLVSSETYQIKHIELFKSELSRSGAVYTALTSCELCVQ